jgi:hypothetical protein
MNAKIITLPSGRPVLDTGRVLVGIRAPAHSRDIGVHAEKVQTALLRPDPRSHVMCSTIPLPDSHDRATRRARRLHEAAVAARRVTVIDTDNSLTARLVRVVLRLLPTTTRSLK